MFVSWCTRCSVYVEDKKAAPGAGLHLPPCVRQGLLVPLGVPKAAPEGSFVSTSHLTYRSPGIPTCTMQVILPTDVCSQALGCIIGSGLLVNLESTSWTLD